VTWSDDDHQYTAWGDGDGFEGASRFGYGFAKLEGAPESYAATDLGEFSPGGGGGKISGVISLGGVLYVTFNKEDGSPPTIALRKSVDKGSTISGDIFTFGNSNQEPLRFVNMGKDFADDRDGYVYVAGENRTTNDDLYLWRVSVAGIETLGNWEVFSGTPSNPAWSSTFADKTTVFNRANGVIAASMIYYPSLQKFILTTHDNAGDLRAWSIHSANNPWGPWTQIAEYTTWCSFGVANTLFKSLAPKWLDQGTPGVFWMTFSGSGAFDRFNLIKGTFTLE
jgi:hypothetical protein